MELKELERNEKIESENVEKNLPAEKEIELQVVIEKLRLVVHGSFLGLTILGIILTSAWGGIPLDNMLTRIFGTRQICLYFDFR